MIKLSDIIGIPEDTMFNFTSDVVMSRINFMVHNNILYSYTSDLATPLEKRWRKSELPFNVLIGLINTGNPQPTKFLPSFGEYYYSIDLNLLSVEKYKWGDSPRDLILYKAGLVFINEDAAKATITELVITAEAECSKLKTELYRKLK